MTKCKFDYSRRTVILTYSFVLRTVPLQSPSFSVNDNGTFNERTNGNGTVRRTLK